LESDFSPPVEVSQLVEDTAEDEVSEENGVVDGERQRFSPSAGTWMRTFPGMETFSERIEYF
jgi:hypothetical protein